MKSFFYLIIIPLIAITISCKPKLQEKNLPAGMIQAFKAKYPEAKNISWSKADTGKFEAVFSLKKENLSCIFSSDASWILTEKKIKTRKLPATVINTIENGFGDYSIKSVRQVESASMGTYYTVKIKSGKEQLYLNLSHDGVILNYNELKRNMN